MEALVSGRFTPDALNVTATDFYYPAYTAVVSVLEALDDKGLLDGPPNHDTIAAVLNKQGIDQERMLDLLFGLVENVPMRANVEELASKVCLLRQHRDTLRLMQRLDNLWRLGEEPPEALLKSIRGALAGEIAIIVPDTEWPEQAIFGIDSQKEESGHVQLTHRVTRDQTLERLIMSRRTREVIKNITISNGETLLAAFSPSGNAVALSAKSIILRSGDLLSFSIKLFARARITFTCAGRPIDRAPIPGIQEQHHAETVRD